MEGEEQNITILNIIEPSGAPESVESTAQENSPFSWGAEHFQLLCWAVSDEDVPSDMDKTEPCSSTQVLSETNPGLFGGFLRLV